MRKRRSLKQIAYYPSGIETVAKILKAEGWPYKSDNENYQLRDKAMISITYILALRISETLRLIKEQFLIDPKKITVRGIELSKRHQRENLRREQYRELGFISLKGERSELGLLVKKYLNTLGEKEQLFKFGRIRAYQIFTANFDLPCHWFRAFGEDYLYTIFKHDILAVSDYTKQDVRTLGLYLRKRYMKYPIS